MANAATKADMKTNEITHLSSNLFENKDLARQFACTGYDIISLYPNILCTNNTMNVSSYMSVNFRSTISEEFHVPLHPCMTTDSHIICKECSNISDNLSINAGIKTIINSLDVYCKHNISGAFNDDNNNGEGIHDTSNKGCVWRGKVSKYIEHLKVCKFQPILCQYCKSYETKRYQMPSHYNVCKYVAIDCELKCDSKVLRKDVESHKVNECPNYAILCSNNVSCGKYIKRCEYDNHINNECQYKLILCPFGAYGCSIKLSKADMVGHVNDKDIRIYHQLMQLNYNISCNNSLIKMNYKPNKPEFKLGKCQYNNIAIYTLSDDNIDEYILKYTKMERISSYINDSYSDPNYRLNTLLMDDEKIEWENITIKSDNNNVVITGNITDVDLIKHDYLLSIKSKNEYGTSKQSLLVSPSIFPTNILIDHPKLSGNFLSMISKQLNKPIHLTKIYDTTSDGFKASTLHSKIQEISPLLYIIQNENDYIFGGYTSISCPSYIESSTNYDDKSAFLFGIKPNLFISPLKDQSQSKYAIYYNNNYNILFGYGHDIAITDECNINKNKSTFKTYQFINPLVSHDQKDGSTAYFKVLYFEVYKIS